MNGKRIIQVVKTFDGALWAQQQVSELIKLGWDVHVLTPCLKGRYLSAWLSTGATLHEIACDFPVRSPWNLSSRAMKLRELILQIAPVLIHSHFVSTTLMLRYALKDEDIPRLFQVPGPLHLEHPFFGQWETFWANNQDFWIASSRYIRKRYTAKYGIKKEKVFLSYYGTDLSAFTGHSEGYLRKTFDLPEDSVLVGNVSFIYPPKLYLGQKVGLKGHELMIESLAEVMKEFPKMYAIFIGQQWGESQAYYEKLKTRADKLSSRILFTGHIPQTEIAKIWQEFDLALHLPSSENCGGVIEPLLNRVPVIASAIGGLPEIIRPGETGYLVQKRRKEDVVQKLREALLEKEASLALAQNGKRLVQNLFDIKRTSKEISDIYKTILEKRTLKDHQ